MKEVFIVKYHDNEDCKGIVDVCATEEIAQEMKGRWKKEYPEDDVWIEPWAVITEVPINLKDFNRNEVKPCEKFKLKGSDHIFMSATYEGNDTILIDITDGVAFPLEDIFCGATDFCFYEDPKDDDFLGVEVIEGD